MGYEDAQAGAHMRTAFRNAEKHYKRYTQASSLSKSSRKKVPATDLHQVLDIRKIGAVLGDQKCSVQGVSRFEGPFDWAVYTLDAHPGFYFIPEALSAAQQLHWIVESLTTFPQPPNRTNHNAIYGPLKDLWLAYQEGKVLKEIASSTRHLPSVAESDATRRYIDIDGGVATAKAWQFCDRREACGQLSKVVPAELLFRKLRWATLGLQFDWSKRAYDESLPYSMLPTDLAQLAARLAEAAVTEGEFKAEAAIVNYYGPDDMLGGHVDDMEADWSKPIVSISLGCKAVFLLGGASREESPTAMFVRSGDVVLMAGPARRCFHGVPRIFVDSNQSEVPDFAALVESQKGSSNLDSVVQYINQSRINVNIRQVH
ncbi:unnamed protein product [Sphagnum balticum]